MDAELLIRFGSVLAVALAGLIIGSFLKDGKLRRARGELEEAKKALAEKDRAIEELERAKAGLETSLQAKTANYKEQAAQLVVLKEQLERNFQQMAASALEKSQTSLLQAAKSYFEDRRKATSTDLKQNQDAIGELLKPLSETLARYERKIEEIETERRQSFGSIAQQLEQVTRANGEIRDEAAKLARALRTSPKIKGAWGEQQLQKVLELAGMSEHVEFPAAKSPPEDSDRLQPDAILRLPGDRQLVIDAKTSMEAFLDANEAADEAQRARHLEQHARDLRRHMEELASQAYWDELDEAPDFVVMFVPGDQLFAAAVERDAAIFEDAVAGRVLIATPTTLVALAKAIAYGWRQEKVSQAAREIREIGQELYRQLSELGGQIGSLGHHLDASAKAYNSLVGDLENKVFGQARKLAALDGDATAKGAANDIALLEPVETAVRAQRRGFTPSVAE